MTLSQVPANHLGKEVCNVNDVAKGVFICAALVVLTLVIISYVKGFMGKPTRNTLRVPLGKIIVPVLVSDVSRLKPYKFSQAFDAQVVLEPGDSIALLYRGKKFGVSDPENDYTKVLVKLMQRTDKVVVQAMVYSLDADKNPLVKLMLPDATWFKRALEPSRTRE